MESIEEVFEEIFDLVRDCEFAKIDAILEKVDVDTESHSKLIGYLSASNPGKRYLAARVQLLERVETRLRADGVDDVDGLLRGLR